MWVSASLDRGLDLAPTICLLFFKNMYRFLVKHFNFQCEAWNAIFLFIEYFNDFTHGFEV